jgi:MinD superfamily P-loop ATPase
MQQLVVLSGKGGTGKTTVAAALAHLAGRQARLVLVDADVDAANLGLVVPHQTREEHEFAGRDVAWIDSALCLDCGICFDTCRFDAVSYGEGYRVDPLACEGCRACFHACSVCAIELRPTVAGKWFRSDTDPGPLFHARLHAGQENSGKLVTELKRRAVEEAHALDADLVLIDGPPGTACPVIAAASGCDLALLVAEPSLSGLHDLTRVMVLVEKLGVPAVVCVNKSDLSPRLTEAIHDACHSRGVDVIAEIPFDPSVTRATVAGVAVTWLGEGSAQKVLRDLWERLEERAGRWTSPAA